MTAGNRPRRRRRPPAPQRDLTGEEMNALAEAIAHEWELGQNTTIVALNGWRGLNHRTTRSLWRLWHDTFGHYPNDTTPSA